MTLHLLGIVAANTRLPEVGSVRLISCDDSALIVQEVPPDFGSEAAGTLTEALLTEGWGAMCRLAETRTVVALRFGQVVADEEAARNVCVSLTKDGVLDRMQGLEGWTITFFSAQSQRTKGRGYLAARSLARQRQADLFTSLQGLADKIDTLKAMSAPARTVRGVTVQMLLERSQRAGTLEGIESIAKEEALDAHAVGPQPVRHFANGGMRHG